MTTKDVTENVTSALRTAIPGATVVGDYHSDLNAWTWTATVWIDEETSHGVSRQFVATDGKTEPTEEDIANMVTEMASTLQGEQA